MDNQKYFQFLTQYVQEALQNSDRTNSGISTYLSEIQVKGLFLRNKEERQRALNDARKAFDEHRHWPLDIVLSHLGVKVE